MVYKKFIFGGQELTLLPEKAVFIEKSQILLLSDLHLGKASHFRKAGIPVPAAVNRTNLDNLAYLLIRHKPSRVFFIGDLFHSHFNQEWESFGQLMEGFPETSFELISGNHDILSTVQYERVRLKCYPNLELFPEFFLIHEPDPAQKGFQICGHLHPSVKLTGKGRQSVTLPCFWFSNQVGVLPAFGAFTGRSIIRPSKTDRVFVIVEEKVTEV
jgi:DNA ligase-associated metallophosphoesterase